MNGREPLGEIVGVLVEPVAQIREIGVDGSGRPEDTSTERCGADAEDVAEFVAEPGPVQVVSDGSRHRFSRSGWHRNDGRVTVADTEQRPNRPVPCRLEAGRIAHHVHTARRRRPFADPRSQVQRQLVGHLGNLSTRPA